MSIRVDNGSTYVRDLFPNGPAAASGMVEKGQYDHFQLIFCILKRLILASLN